MRNEHGAERGYPPWAALGVLHWDGPVRPPRESSAPLIPRAADAVRLHGRGRPAPPRRRSGQRIAPRILVGRVQFFLVAPPFLCPLSACVLPLPCLLVQAGPGAKQSDAPARPTGRTQSASLLHSYTLRPRAFRRSETPSLSWSQNLGRQCRSKNGDPGGAGYRSPCLSHAKRALYHLSYTPLLVTLGRERN